MWSDFQKPKKLDYDPETLTPNYGRFIAQPIESPRHQSLRFSHAEHGSELDNFEWRCGFSRANDNRFKWRYSGNRYRRRYGRDIYL